MVCELYLSEAILTRKHIPIKPLTLCFKRKGGDVTGQRARMHFCFYLVKMKIGFLKKPLFQSCFRE